MNDPVVDIDEGTKSVLLDLFTEITILEHLVRFRFEPEDMGDLTAADFGVLNHFVRLGKQTEKLKTLAWSFQVELVTMRETVAALAARRFLEVDWVAGDECVFLTDAGHMQHREAVRGMAPDILDIVGEIDPADLRTTAETLKEIRRTFDNLPDR